MKPELKKLIEIGLPTNEAKVYHYLLQVKNSTAGEISDRSGVPRSKIYVVLNNLIQKGFCTEISGKVRTFKAGNPKYAFNQLIEDMDQRKSKLKDASSYYQELFANLQRDENALNYVEVIQSKSGLIEKVSELIPKTKKSILTFARPPYMISAEDSEWQSQENASHTATLENRSVMQIERDDLPRFIKIAKQNEQEGELIRLVDDLPMKFFIFDDQYVIFMLTDERDSYPQLMFMAIKNAGLAKTLTCVFELYWSQGMTINELENRTNKD